MTLNRQYFSLAACLVCALSAGAAGAQSGYPDKPVRMIATYAPGGGLDAIARLLADKMAATLGQPVIVENRAGAAGKIGMTAVANAPADGYTLLIAGAGELVVQPAFKDKEKAAQDALAEFVPIVLVAESPNFLVAHPSVEGTTLAELVKSAGAQAAPAIGSPGTGTTQHLALEVIKADGAVELIHVPYRGAGPALNDVLAGQTQFAILGAPPALPHIKSKALRGIAVASAKRSPLAPDVPTVKEAFGIDGVDSGTWYGLLAPAKTPPAALKTIEDAALAALADPEVKRKIAELGSEVLALPHAQFTERMKTETARNAQVVHRFKLKLN